jgi:hypothetical protein
MMTRALSTLSASQARAMRYSFGPRQPSSDANRIASV